MIEVEMRRLVLVLPILSLIACQRLEEVGRAPSFTPIDIGSEFMAMTSPTMPRVPQNAPNSSDGSLWSGARSSLLGDRRASQSGDIMTVVIEINDRAEITNTTGRTRSGSDAMGIPALLGIPQRINEDLPQGASLDDAFAVNSSSSFRGNGSVSRNEKLTLRVAVTIIERLPNGVLRIQGSQEVRVNFEVRELIVTATFCDPHRRIRAPMRSAGSRGMSLEKLRRDNPCQRVIMSSLTISLWFRSWSRAGLRHW
jgi:flagellar L-ring protein precursor FlgH